MTSYERIYKAFLRKIDDADFADRLEFTQEYAEEDMLGWLHSAVAKLSVRTEDAITFD